MSIPSDVMEAVTKGEPLPTAPRSDLQRVQANLSVPKNRFNKFGEFNYRSCEDILEAAKPMLDELGCTLTLTDTVVVLGDSQPGVNISAVKSGDRDEVDFNNRFYFVATAAFRDSTGEITEVQGYAREPKKKKGMDSSQLSGATSSYARKYALNGLFLLDDNKDADSTFNFIESDIDAFKDLIGNEDGVTLLLMQVTDTDRYLALVREATPKAGRVKFKEDLSDLVKKAAADAQTQGQYLIELIDKDDAMGIQEAVEELSEDEKKLLWRQLKPQYQDHVRAIMKGSEDD